MPNETIAQRPMLATSELLDQLATALSKAQGEMDGAKKGAVNPFFNHKYADLASVKEAIREPFAKAGLSIVQFPQTTYQGTPEAFEWTAKRSGEVRHGVRVFCIVTVVTRLLHSSGQWMEDAVSAMLPNGDPQAVGSAITYLRRYALQAVAGIATEDDDAEAAQGGPAAVAVMAKATLPIPSPAGYLEWLDTLAGAAVAGTPKLETAWKASAKKHQAHLMVTNPEHWDALKAAAAKVAA